MHALIVISHPNRNSLTHAIAANIKDGLNTTGGAHTVEIADLDAEGFDPRFTASDIAVHLSTVQPSAEMSPEWQDRRIIPA